MAEAPTYESLSGSVADLTLRDEEGAAVRFGDLYKDQRTLVIFVRVRLGCTVVMHDHTCKLLIVFQHFL